jgi:hypothetical protein
MGTDLPPAFDVVGNRGVLVIAHPGHELCVHRWLELARPVVCVLTDGSGRAGRPRLHATSRVLAGAGATPGPIYGRLPDLAAYAVLLERDVETAAGLVEELASTFVRERAAYVVGDPHEGHNPVHDLCRALVDAAVATASRALGRGIASFDFPLMERSVGPEARARETIRLSLDDAAFARKLAAARTHEALAAEIAASVAAEGRDAFRVESLRRIRGRPAEFVDPPFYERYGECLVAAGHYPRVLRYRDHFAPLAAAIRKQAETGGGAACAS